MFLYLLVGIFFGVVRSHWPSLYPCYSDPDDASKLQAPILELKYSAREPKGGNWEPGMRRDQVDR